MSTLPFILARLLLTLQSVEESAASGKLLSDHSNPDMAELISSCFQPLLLLLVWQLGESTSTEEV